MTDEEWQVAQSEWRNSANWRFGHYAAKRDPRTWVRKQNVVYGWTLNFAHPSSWWWMAMAIILPVVLIGVVAILREW